MYSSRKNCFYLGFEKVAASLIMDKLAVQVHRKIYIWSL